MSREAISARLRTLARLLEERGFSAKGVDMSRTAVTLRLQSMAALSTMCLRLGKATIASRGDKP
jgi:ActR/RegA family two-component response regulator